MVLYGTCKKTPLSQVDYGVMVVDIMLIANRPWTGPLFPFFFFPAPFGLFVPGPWAPPLLLLPVYVKDFLAN